MRAFSSSATLLLLAVALKEGLANPVPGKYPDGRDRVFQIAFKRYTTWSKHAWEDGTRGVHSTDRMCDEMSARKDTDDPRKDDITIIKADKMCVSWDGATEKFRAFQFWNQSAFEPFPDLYRFGKCYLYLFRDVRCNEQVTLGGQDSGLPNHERPGHLFHMAANDPANMNKCQDVNQGHTGEHDATFANLGGDDYTYARAASMECFYSTIDTDSYRKTPGEFGVKVGG